MSSLPPPDGAPPAARAAEVLAAPSGEQGAATRARMMAGMQQAVGNARVGRMLGTAAPAVVAPRPAAAPVAPAAPIAAAAPMVSSPIPAPQTVTTPAAVSGGAAASPSTPPLAATPPASPATASGGTTGRPTTPPPVAQGASPAVLLGAAAPKVVASSPGEPLQPQVQETLEKSFGVDLKDVRVHQDSVAQKTAQGLGARAFTYGQHIFLGPREQATDVQLIAHEVAHVVQQQAAPAVQRMASGVSDPLEREAHQASDAAMKKQPATVEGRTPAMKVQRFGVDTALNYLADKANLIPGFRMFTIVLGVNPVNMSKVDRSPANILRAIVEFLPGGVLISQALENSGIFEKVGNWIAQQLSTLGNLGSALKKALDQLLDSLSWGDVLDLESVWTRAKNLFTAPINQVIDFAKGLVTDILKFIKDAILMPLAKLAEGTRGWDLLIAVLGKNPITGEPVERNAENLVGGFLKLIGKEDIWENIKKANALARIWAWFQGALAGLMVFVNQIPTLFKVALQSLELADIVLVPRAFAKLAGVFGGFIINFIKWAGNALWKLLEIVFDVVSPGAWNYIKKTGAALRSILQNPLPFVGNLVKAAKQGFIQFGDNIGTHLKNGLIDWLTGSLAGANIYIPKALNLVELGKFALSVFGITWASIRAKIVKALGPSGETIMKTLETTFDIIIAFVKGGLDAVWDLIKEKITGLKDMVIDGIMGFVIDAIVKKAIPKLIAMFIPGAGFISAIISIYDTIKVFVEKISKIVEVVMAFIDSIVAIAGGAIGAAASRVERILGGLLSLAISFLAGFLGLGKVADKIIEVIQKVREMVDKALDAGITWIITKAKSLFASLFGKKDEQDDPEKAAKIQTGLAQLHAEGAKFVQQKSIAKQDAEQVASSVKSKNPVFKSITVVAGDETWDYEYTASPSRKEKGDIPRRVVVITTADLLPPKESVKPGSWDVTFAANVSGEEKTWGFVHVPLGPDPDLPPPKPEHNMYLDNRVELKGEPIKLKLIDGSFTDYALTQSIALYEKRYGELKELHGDLRFSNLANFQKEFAIRRKQEMDKEPAAQEAIRAISFGKARENLGYKTFELALSGEKIINIEGVGNSYVPTSVTVIARK